MTYTEEDWRRTMTTGGRGTAMSVTWLLNGCPHCGTKTWMLTSDGWAYCDGCLVGISTDGIWVNGTIKQLNADGTISDYPEPTEEA